MKKVILVFGMLITGFGISAQTVVKTYDKFKKETMFTVAGNANIEFIKFIPEAREKSVVEDGNWKSVYYTDTVYMVRFYVRDTYLTFDASDVHVLFKDGSELYINDDASFDVSGDRYSYTCYSFDRELIVQMATKKLDAFKLHIFERNISSENQVLIQKAAQKILAAQ